MIVRCAGVRVPRRGPTFPLAALLALTVSGACGGEPPEPADPGELLTVRTVGLALLEENRLDEAEVEFLRLIALAPNEPLGYANLGLTYLRLGRLEDAGAQVRQALELEPGAADVRLILAEVLLAQDDPDEARSVLEMGLQADSLHVKTLYALATIAEDAGGPDSAARRVDLLSRLVELQPGNVAARVELMVAYLRDDRGTAAAIQLEELAQLVPTIPVEGQDAYTEALSATRDGGAQAALGPALGFMNVMRTVPVYQQGLIDLRGPGGVLLGFPVVLFSETLGADVRDPETVLAALRFTDATALVGLPVIGTTQSGALAVVDYDGDADRDVYVGGRLLRNDITGFTDVTAEVGLDGPPPSDARFGDYDNDGALDLFVSRAGQGWLFRNDGGGGFVDVTGAIGVRLPDGSPLFMDADQDGDLDLLVSGPQGASLFRNNLDGSFTDVSVASGVATADASGRVAFGDLDDDDDLEIITSASGSMRILDNLRSGQFVDVASDRGAGTGAAAGVAVGDYNNDGWLDLLVGEAGGIRLLLNDGAGAFSPDLRPTELLGAARAMTVHDVAFVDFDNDGWLDVFLVGEGAGGAGAARLFRNAAAGDFDDLSSILPEVLPPLRRIAIADFGDDGDLDLFASGADGSVRLLRNDGGNGNRYLKMQLVGLSTGSGKNNYFGIGAKIEVRAGGLYQTLVVTGPDIHLGLGQHARADVVRVRWTNGVPQNLFYPNANQSVVEEQILKGSCPFLYAWNGERFDFVTDIMWKSALGMPMGLMARGEAAYAPPTASQGFVRIPGSALSPKDGAYELRVTGELWEVFYIDEIELVIVDHPDSVDVFVDERFVFPEPGTPLELHQVATAYPPLSAVDERGEDVLERLLHADDRYVDRLTPERYQGVSELHDLVLDLGVFSPSEVVKLYLRGWIFPTDASINVAISQSAVLATLMPSIEVVDASGSWVTAVEVLSFPAGKNKVVIQELTGLFPTDDHRVRIRTNMNVYWDHAFFTLGDAQAPVRVTTVQPTEADFRYRGFSAMSRKGGRFGPHWFDYASESKESPWRPIAGGFTRYGDVLDLVAESDDRYPIMAPGDELSLRFPVTSAPTLPEGWSRDFLIYSDGWIKDADLNTAEGWRVAPLPFHGMSRYPYGSDEEYPFPELLDTRHTRTLSPPPALGGGRPDPR